jgi:hypothetical protein
MKPGPPEPRAKAEVPHCGTKEDQRSVVCRLACHAEVPRLRDEGGLVSSRRQLLSYFLKLLTDYRSVKAIDGDVKPIVFFAFHDEVVKTCGIGFVMPCLRDQVDE